uniref:Uncharacterized protein LOC105036814 n=2 Tax=Elaeis guineensis var. tenera TaxID=51953 RepID=A0A6I9QM95_ELAGV|nr:uncharacterized protein LOC105036814 [Elaeis guineensis]
MQLLDDFCSDDACPLGTLFTVSPGQSTPFGSKTNSISQKVIPSAFAIDDDIFTEASDSPADYKSNLCKDTNLLSVNQLLDSVLETATHVGRLSVSSTSDVPFKEMASQCEALLVGKQQKLSVCMSTRQQQQFFLSGLSQDDKEMKHSSHLCTEQLQMIGNPFVEPNFNAYACTVTATTTLLFPTEYQCQPQFRLPASNPFDNFLKAAGW